MAEDDCSKTIFAASVLAVAFAPHAGRAADAGPTYAERAVTLANDPAVSCLDLASRTALPMVLDVKPLGHGIARATVDATLAAAAHVATGGSVDFANGVVLGARGRFDFVLPAGRAPVVYAGWRFRAVWDIIPRLPSRVRPGAAFESGRSRSWCASRATCVGYAFASASASPSPPTC